VNSVQGSDELWRQELEQVNARMKESLRMKAQLSDSDIDNCYRSFVQDLLHRKVRTFHVADFSGISCRYMNSGWLGSQVAIGLKRRRAWV